MAQVDLSPDLASLLSEASVAYMTSHGLLFRARHPVSHAHANDATTASKASSKVASADKHAHGAPPRPWSECAIHVTATLVPTPVPKAQFEFAVACGTVFNTLVDKMGRDYDFLMKCLQQCSNFDRFTLDLVRIAKIVNKEGVTQPIQVGSLRTDYMLQLPRTSKQQTHTATTTTNDTINSSNNNASAIIDKRLRYFLVEINTIAAGFIDLGPKTTATHRYIVGRYGHLLNADKATKHVKYDVKNIPANNARVGFAEGIAKACSLQPYKRKIMLMVTHTRKEHNQYDQRGLEYQLWNDHHIYMIMMTLIEVYKHATLAPTTKDLMINGVPISLVYFRGGYSPPDYDNKEYAKQWWDARLLIERSRSIKCPSIGYQLVGLKKVQQVLCVRGVLERYLNGDECVRIRGCFCGTWGFDEGDEKKYGGGGAKKKKKMISKSNDNTNKHQQQQQPQNNNNITNHVPSSQSKQQQQQQHQIQQPLSAAAAIAHARTHPSQYVLKPQREGGGNNLYGKHITQALTTWSKDKLKAYILMELIRTPPRRSWLVNEGKVVCGDTLSELGIFSLFVGDGKKTYFNKTIGYVQRTKLSHVNEGGVSSGFAGIDSVYLV